jgi:hypothetical protein
MRRLSTIGLCTLAVLAISAVAAATAAAAQPPEYGHCVAKPAHEGTGFTNSTCTKAGIDKRAKFEWLTGPGAKPGFTWKAHFGFSERYKECKNAIGEEEVAIKLRNKAESAPEPEKGELIREAERNEQNAKEDYQDAANGKGELTRAQCETVLEEETAKSPAYFETVPVPTGHGKQTRPELKVACGEVNASGEFSGERTVGVVVTFTECGATSGSCSSSGAAEGEIVSTLDGELGFVEKKHKLKAAISLTGEGGAPFAAFSCGSESAVVEGSVITTVAANSARISEEVDFSQSKGVQAWERFVGGPEDVLSTSINGGAGKTTGLMLKVHQENEEAIEVNTEV